MAKLYVVVSPYRKIDPTTLEDLFLLPSGSILFLDQGRDSLENLILETKRTAEAAPTATLLLGVRMSEGLADSVLEALRSAGRGALLPSGSPELPTLLQAARKAAGSAEQQVAQRFRLLGRDVAPVLEHAIGGLFTDARISTVDESASELHLSSRTLRRLLSHEGAPPPHLWLELARVIRGVRLLQENPRRLVPDLLTRAGFGSSKTGREAVKRTAGMRPRQAGQLIGWYWILERWIRLYWPARAPLPREATAD